MANGKFVAYFRVSTARQGASGLGLEAQKESVNSYLNGGKWKIVKDFVEVESGKNAERPQLARALALCRIHNPTLIVAKIDRLTRNVNFLFNLMESKVDFVAADFPTAKYAQFTYRENTGIRGTSKTESATVRSEAKSRIRLLTPLLYTSLNTRSVSDDYGLTYQSETACAPFVVHT